MSAAPSYCGDHEAAIREALKQLHAISAREIVQRNQALAHLDALVELLRQAAPSTIYQRERQQPDNHAGRGVGLAESFRCYRHKARKPQNPANKGFSG